MKRAGKGSVRILYINNKFVARGTWEEIGEKLGVNVNTLRSKISNCKKRKNPRVKYEMVIVEDVRKEYELYENDEKVGKGTIKELSEMHYYSYSHLINLARGERGSKKLVLKEVG